MARRISFTSNDPEERRYLEVAVELAEVFRCTECGSLVVDRQAHDEHHARTEW